MFFLAILFDYLNWHYTDALRSYIRIYKNFWWFFVNLFSIPQLAYSLFSPYKRITEPRASIFDFENWLGSIMINLVSRIFGFIIRIHIIVAGLVALSLYFVLAAFGYLFWLLAPMLLLGSFLYGMYLIS